MSYSEAAENNQRSSASAPTKLVPQSLVIEEQIPRRSVNRLKAVRKPCVE